MPLQKYEDFLELSNKQLTDFLSVRGMSTAGRKIELVARSFTAMELGYNIIASSEGQKQQLENDYQVKLEEINIPDPNLIEERKRIDDITKWPAITLGTIFSYILKKKEFTNDYIGKYKDQKAYSVFDSGFVGSIFIYEVKTHKKVMFLYCNVRASQTIHEYKNLWIAIKILDTNNSEILSAWCSCMAGSYETCNHVIAALYKIEYAYNKGWCSPTCTDTPCQWNQSTQKVINPKKITDLVVRKKIRTNLKSPDEDAREGVRMGLLQEFDPRIESHREILEEDLVTLLQNVKECKENAVIFKSCEFKELTCEINSKDFKMASIGNLTVNQVQPGENYDNDLVKHLMENICVTDNEIKHVENATKGQSDNSLWFELRAGRLTASNHHNIYTKMNTYTKASIIKPKTTPTVEKFLNPSKHRFKTDATEWGIINESIALKTFYAKHLSLHRGSKTATCGLYLDKHKPYLAASPDGIIECDCHGKSLIEIKCPYSFRNNKIIESVKNCQFLYIENNNIKINKAHKYYTQIISQMAIAEISKCYFVVWTTVDIHFELIEFDKVHWLKVLVNLEVFFKSFVCPALLYIKPLVYCGKCDKVLLQENEIDSSEENELNSIECDRCGCWFHLKCEKLTVKDASSMDDEWICSCCLQSPI